MLYPNNWLRPRFRWTSTNNQNLFELRLHVQNQANDLVVYTAASSWTMPKSMWDGLRTDSADQPMTVTVRGGTYANGALAGVSLGSTGGIGVAPVEAGGAIVYWGIDKTANTAWLKGFSVGDDAVQMVLQPSQTHKHRGPVDGMHWVPFCNSGWKLRRLSGLRLQLDQWHRLGGRGILGNASGLPQRRRADGAGYSAGSPGLFDAALVGRRLHRNPPRHGGSALGGARRRGHQRHRRTPARPCRYGIRYRPIVQPRRDASCIRHASSVAPTGGRATSGPIDIYAMHYNAKMGGDAAPLNGAALSNENEYYPAFSLDDAWVTFTRSDDSRTSNTYADPNAEIFVIPSVGGMATRLSANDPPACSGSVSPGVQNSWSKWSPTVGQSNGRTFYWLIFSSSRQPSALFSDGSVKPQLYVTALEIDAAGLHDATRRAFYLWNQPDLEHNHLPAWDNFNIPPQTAQ